MNADETMTRLRDANPATASTSTDEELFAAIVATPGDPRLRDDVRRPPRRGWSRIAVVVAALTLGVGAAWAATGGALELFQTNPQSDGAAPESLWDQDVIPASVVRAAVLPIPQYGDLEFWYGDAEQGGWCGAIRLPNGQWAATKESGVGGTAPGCYPTREQTNGDDPIFVINGFDYYEVQIDARAEGGSFWRVYYGILATEKPVAAVVDRISGRRAQVHRGERFAIAVPDSQPERTVPLAGNTYAVDLVAYDADGEVIAAEHP